jgi:phosphate:Na+ symporter
MSELLAVFLAGLSLFFTGVAGVKSRLQQLSGRRCRQILAKVTDRSILAGLVGLMFGAITQSASAVAFILSGMVATGLISLRRALPVVAASNVGTAALVFLAAFDMKLAIFFLIGVTGLMIAFRIGHKFEAIIGALFSIGLLFYGLELMKQAFGPMPGYEWFQTLAAFLKQWAVAPFLLGAALRMIIQSSSAIGVIAIALQAAGLFTEFQSVMLICGAGPGVALAALFLSGNLSGPPRQIVLYQGIINLVSGTVLALAFLVTARSGGGGPIFDLIYKVARDSNDCLAWTFFLSMSGCLFAGLAILPWTERFLGILAPPTIEQDISRPAYLHEEAFAVPDTAVELVGQEQQRFLGVVTTILESVRDESKSGVEAKPSALRTGGVTLGGEITVFLKELINRNVSSETAGEILSLERRQENLSSLLETVYRYAVIRSETSFNPQISDLMDRLSESLHLILMTAADAWRSHDEADQAFLLKLTEDRGEMMERLRRSYQMAEGGAGQVSALFYATTLFERSVWIVRQVGLSLKGPLD